MQRDPATRLRRHVLAIATAAVITLAAVGCGLGGVETVVGSGVTSTLTHGLGSFEGVTVRADLQVRIDAVGGVGDTVTVAADDNLHDHLQVNVEDGRLIIEPENNTDLVYDGDIVVTVDPARLSAVRAEADARVSTTIPQQDRVDLQVASDAVLAVQVQADAVDVEASSDGAVVVEAVAESVSVQAASDATVTALVVSQHADVQASSDATIEVAGTLDSVDIEASSDAVVRVTAAGIADATVAASSDAEITVAASGTVSGEARSDGLVVVVGDADIDIATSSDGSVQRG